jgi:hypothetical protein
MPVQKNCNYPARPGSYPWRWALGALVALAPALTHAEEFRQDFLGRPYDQNVFLKTGSNHARVVQTEPRGLRIALPTDHGNKQPVGLVAATGAHGDFEITMEFDLLQVDKPTTGYGAGVSIYIATAAPTKEAATIARVVRPDGTQVLTFHRATTSSEGKRQHHTESLATEAQSGKLRLVRSGTTLSYQFARGESNAFHEVHEAELGEEDLEMIRFAADAGGSPTLVDVCIKAVSIKADDFGSARSPLPSSPWSFWWLAGLAVLLTAAAGYWLWSRPPPADSPKDKR